MKSNIQKTSRISLIVFPVLLVMSLVVSVSCQTVAGSSPSDQRQTVASSSPSAQRQTVVVQKSTIARTVSADGNISFPNQQKLYFDTSGKIAEIRVVTGDRVSKGQLLAKLDDTIQRLAIDSAQNDVTLAENQFAKRVCTPWGPNVVEFYNAPGALDTLVTTKAELDRAIAALESQRYDDARKEMSLVQDDIERSRNTLQEHYVTQFRYGVDDATSIQWTLQSKKAQIALQMAKEEMKKTQIVAPFDGVIADVPLKVGDRLSSSSFGSTVVIQLIDPDVVEMKGVVGEIDRPKVKVGQPTLISVDALSDAEVSGIVTFVSPMANMQTGVVSYNITLAIPKPDNIELRDGMTATANLLVGQAQNALMIPETTVKDKGVKPYVDVMSRGDVERRYIRTGMSDGKTIEVLSGLSEGEQVVIPLQPAKTAGLSTSK